MKIKTRAPQSFNKASRYEQVRFLHASALSAHRSRVHVRSDACARRRRIAAEPYRVAGTSRWARRRSRKKSSSRYLKLPGAQRTCRNFSVHGKSCSIAPLSSFTAPRSRSHARGSFIFFIPFVFSHLSVWTAARSECRG